MNMLMFGNTNLQITYDTITDKGERPVNEDYLGITSFGDSHYFILCDGLGGHGNGNVASHFVVEQLAGCMQLGGMSMEQGIQYAQNALLKKQKQEGKEDSMKTTVTCLQITGNHAKFAHVGDSRIYMFTNGKYKMRSQDHSVPQMLVNNGSIKEEEIRHHPDRSRILRVMGSEWNSPKYQVVDDIKLGKKVSFLLCSDGFWELIDEKNMSELLKKSVTPGEWLSSMQQVIVTNGKGTNMDNYSAIAVFIR